MKQLVATGLVLLVSTACLAQESYVTVSGTGSVKVAPDYFVVPTTLMGSGETVSETMADLKKKREKLEEAFDPMAFPKVKTIYTGPTLSRKSAHGHDEFGMPVAADPEDGNAEGFWASETVQFKVKIGPDATAESVHALVDKIQKALSGADLESPLQAFGHNPAVVNFGIADQQASSDQAYANAMEKARRKAEMLAKLSGKKLGQVISIESADVVQNGNGFRGISFPQIFYDELQTPSSDSRFESIDISATIQVKFELMPK